MESAQPSKLAEILSRIVRPEAGGWSAAAAEAILSLRLPESDCQRATVLAARAADGSLSDEDAAELDGYRTAGRLLELLKSRARLSLNQMEQPA